MGLPLPLNAHLSYNYASLTTTEVSQVRFPRSSGILLHPTSLPGRFGIGDLGDAAYRFVDFLATAGQSYWQVLPLSPTGYADSPYQTLSAFAGNPMLISPEKLAEIGHLSAADLEDVPAFPADRVDFGPVIRYKTGTGPSPTSGPKPPPTGERLSPASATSRLSGWTTLPCLWH